MIKFNRLLNYYYNFLLKLDCQCIYQKKENKRVRKFNFLDI